MAHVALVGGKHLRRRLARLAGGGWLVGVGWLVAVGWLVSDEHSLPELVGPTLMQVPNPPKPHLHSVHILLPFQLS